MNRFLLPVGLLLAALVASDSVFEHSLRLAELEAAPVCRPEQLIDLRKRVESEREAWTRSIEARWAEERELAGARARSAREEIAHLQQRVSEQSDLLLEQQGQLSEWEAAWSDLTPTTVQRRLFELQAKFESLSAELELTTRQDEAEIQRTDRKVLELGTRLDASLAARDTEKLWGDLVGPIVQLVGDSTVGSGVLLESRPTAAGASATHVLTAWHVVRDIIGRPDDTSAPISVKIYSPEGTWRDITAHLLVRDATLDLALLLLDTTEAMPFGARLAPRSELEALRIFDSVYAVGCPLGNDPIPTVGEVASTHHDIDGAKYWMISAPTYIGNSGGGIYSARTHSLIGIFSKIYTHGSTRAIIVPHMGLATPLSVVYDWLDTTEYADLSLSLEWNGMEWNGMEWNGMEWNMEWNGMEWNHLRERENLGELGRGPDRGDAALDPQDRGHTSMETSSLRQVPCPECGQNFSPRGLSGHRRLRHGLQPAAALPREANRLDAALPQILHALAELRDAIERIEQRLAGSSHPPTPMETPPQEAERLERELAELLQHIVRLKQTGLASTTIRRPGTAMEERASLELARLRRDQARMVFRIEELRHGEPSDERFLT